MSIPPRLAGKLHDVLGADASDDLVNLMDQIRGDLAELRHEKEIVSLKLERMYEGVEKLLERGLREQTRFFFLAWAVLLAAIVGLYAR